MSQVTATVIRNIPQQDVMNELRTFIKGALKLERCNPLELTKTALRLLKNLPASRAAVFEYFSNVFGDAAMKYIHALENELQTGQSAKQPESVEAVLSEIHTMLCGSIADNPTAWAPIVSTWSLELLGEISTKFAGRAHTSTNLNESLQLWMNCRSTKILVDINTKCLSSLMHSDTEACINALLDTSVKHSPNFDWVVAHVGSCFPNTVITRVLSCGLKDFCQIKSYEQGSNSPKLRSVVGILGHLAGSHSIDISKAIWDLFAWSLQSAGDEANRLQKKATVPFILQLAFLSPTFFSSICHDVKHSLSVPIIMSLHHFVDDWCKYFGSSEIVEDILITLIITCDTAAIHIMNLLLDCAGSSDRALQQKCTEILQNILYRLDEIVRQSRKSEMLSSLGHSLPDLLVNLRSTDHFRAQVSAQCLVLLGESDQALLVRTINFLLQNATSPQQLGLVLKILSHDLINRSESPQGGHLNLSLEQVLSKLLTIDDVNSPIWNNLVTLLRWEEGGRVPFLNNKMVSKAIRGNLTKLSKLFVQKSNKEHVICELLDTLYNTKLENVPIEAVLNLTLGAVNYFFFCCREGEGLKKLRGLQRANRLFIRLCTYSNVAKVSALRELLERALFRDENLLFGGKSSTYFELEDDKLLLKQNKKLSKTIPLTKHSSVFNGGIIGSGKRKLRQNNDLPPDAVADNIVALISALKACCRMPEGNKGKFSDISLDSVTLLSLLLVQFVSPDVMYNGLPWPDEEFTKVTIERDLFIRRLFASSPVLWDILHLIAQHRPAICYCSVLLRALTATLIHQWKSTGEVSKVDPTVHHLALMETTVKVVDVMTAGQLLPPPLSHIRDVIPSLQSFEVVAILRDCIWNYFRDNIPSPALFSCDANNIHWRDPTLSRPPEMYTNTLRIILQRNISSLGHMYAQMFINVPKHAE